MKTKGRLTSKNIEDRRLEHISEYGSLSKGYLTPEGREKLIREMDELFHKLRKQLDEMERGSFIPKNKPKKKSLTSAEKKSMLTKLSKYYKAFTKGARPISGKKSKMKVRQQPQKGKAPA